MSSASVFASSPTSSARSRATPATTPIVFVVDDDISVRESLVPLIARAGWRAEVFASAEEFLAHPRHAAPCCLVLDVGLPDLDGLQLQERIADLAHLPIIFITGNWDIPVTVRAMKAGAMEFLTKPFSPEELVEAIRCAIGCSRAYLDEAASLEALRDCYESLTPRERQVMARVVCGCANRQIADELDIREITVKIHRLRAMEKMKAASLAELVNMAARMGHDIAGTTRGLLDAPGVSE